MVLPRRLQMAGQPTKEYLMPPPPGNCNSKPLCGVTGQTEWRRQTITSVGGIWRNQSPQTLPMLGIQNSIRKKAWRVLKELTMELAYDLAFLLPGTYRRDLKCTASQKLDVDVHSNIHYSWYLQHGDKCPPNHPEKARNWWTQYSQIMECYLPTKRNGLLINAIKHTFLKSQSQNITYSIIPFIWYSEQMDKMSRICKSGGMEIDE